MAFQDPKMGLTNWNSPTDPYSYKQWSQNLQRIAFHDHSPGRGVQLSTNSFQDHSITGIKIALGTIEPDNMDSTETANPWVLQTLDVTNLNVAQSATFDSGLNSFGPIHIEGTQPAAGLEILDAGNGTVLALQTYSGTDYITSEWGNAGAPLDYLVAMRFPGSPNQANVTFPNNVAVDETLTTSQLVVTGTSELNYVQASGEGVFLGGVQSGDTNNHHSVVSYGGMIVYNNPVEVYSDIQTQGGSLSVADTYPAMTIIDTGYPNSPVLQIMQTGGIAYIANGGTTWPNPTGAPSAGNIAMEVNTTSTAIPIFPNGISVIANSLFQGVVEFGGGIEVGDPGYFGTQIIAGSGQFGDNWPARPGGAGGAIQTISAYVAGDLVIGGALVFANVYNSSAELLQLAPGIATDGHTALISNAEYVIGESSSVTPGGIKVYTSVPFP